MNKSLIKVRFRFIENKRLIEKYSYLLQTIVQNLFCISVCFFICYNKRIFAGGDARQVAKKERKKEDPYDISTDMDVGFDSSLPDIRGRHRNRMHEKK